MDRYSQMDTSNLEAVVAAGAEGIDGSVKGGTGGRRTSLGAIWDYLYSNRGE